MNKRVRARLFVILCVTIVSIYLFAGLPPSVAKMRDRIHLGLDLQGGILIELQVVTDDAIKAETDHTIEAVRKFLQEEAIAVRQITRVGVDRLEATGINPAKDTEFRHHIAEKLEDWDVIPVTGGVPNTYTVALKPNRESALREQSVDQAMNVIRNRIDTMGVVEPTIQRKGGAGAYQILVELPGVGDPDRVKKIMQSTALLEVRLVDSGPFATEADVRQHYEGTVPDELDVLPSKERGANPAGFYAVRRVAAITGRDLRGAFPSRDEYGHPAVGFNLNADGAQRFAHITEENIGKLLAIVLDNKIQSVATVHQRISDSGIIEGGPAGFSPQEAQDLALVLRSGSLPASIKYLMEQKVSATLGTESIRKGVTAAAIALVAVAAFMLFYYRLSGVNATIAMILNIVICLEQSPTSE